MLTLVIGGAASGKSAWAETHALSQPGPHIYLATMRPFGTEARARIEKHRAMRAGKGFDTLECAVDLASARIPSGANVLLEDLSNLLANELFDPEGGGTGAVERGLDMLLSRCGALTIVSNEVFSGGAAYAGETLWFLRQLALLNRALAKKADLVAEIVCGLPNVLKGEELL